MNMSRRNFALFLLVVVVFFAVAPSAFASTGAQGLAWEGPMQRVRDSLSGPVAYAIVVVGLVVGFGVVLFGGELNEMARKILYVVAAGAVCVGAPGVVTNLFGVNGALI